MANLIKTELVILAGSSTVNVFRIILNYVSDNYHNITSSLSTRYTIYIILHILICSLFTVQSEELLSTYMFEVFLLLHLGHLLVPVKNISVEVNVEVIKYCR